MIEEDKFPALFDRSKEITKRIHTEAIRAQNVSPSSMSAALKELQNFDAEFKRAQEEAGIDQSGHLEINATIAIILFKMSAFMEEKLITGADQYKAVAMGTMDDVVSHAAVVGAEQDMEYYSAKAPARSLSKMANYIITEKKQDLYPKALELLTLAVGYTGEKDSRVRILGKMANDIVVAQKWDLYQIAFSALETNAQYANDKSPATTILGKLVHNVLSSKKVDLYPLAFRALELKLAQGAIRSPDGSENIMVSIRMLGQFANSVRALESHDLYPLALKALKLKLFHEEDKRPGLGIARNLARDALRGDNRVLATQFAELITEYESLEHAMSPSLHR